MGDVAEQGTEVDGTLKIGLHYDKVRSFPIYEVKGGGPEKRLIKIPMSLLPPEVVGLVDVLSLGRDVFVWRFVDEIRYVYRLVALRFHKA